MVRQSFFFQFFFAHGFNADIIDLYVEEHVIETRHRIFHGVSTIILLGILAFFNVKFIVEILKLLSFTVRFFQAAPGEYFASTLKIGLSSGILFSLPFLLAQFVFFFCSGLTNKEKSRVSNLLILSVILLGLSFLFAYFILIPAALNFFLLYSSEIIEPFWSFEQYFNFISVLFLTCGFVFQLPIVQIVLSVVKIINPYKMLSLWKIVILIATILSAILTPSADPVTQVLLTLAIVCLYLTGSLASIYLIQLA